MNTVTVETWWVKLKAMPLEYTIWVPLGSSASDALAAAILEHGANVLAVRRTGSSEWLVAG